MSALAVLIDTDVLIDFLIDREPFTKAAKDLVQKVQENKIEAFLAAHSITNIFYILRKIYSIKERKQILIDLCQTISIIGIKPESVLRALLNNDFDDFEDCLQSECAMAVNADYIITRNVQDYSHSEIPALLPEQLLKKLAPTENSSMP